MRSSWKLLFDVMSESFRKRSRLHRTLLWSCNTRAMRSTDDPDDDSQQGPDFVDARPRADSSSVARCSECRPRADRSAVARFFVADPEPASLRERTREKLQHESGKRARKLHRDRPRRQRGTKPGQQRRSHSAERPCTATSKGKRRRIRIQQKD